MSAARKLIQRVAPIMIRGERHSQEVVKRFDMQLTVEGGTCELVNVSESGIAFLSPVRFTENQEHSLTLTVHGNENLFSGKGIVRRCEQTERGLLYGMALTTGQLSPMLFEAIDAFVGLKEHLDIVREDAEKVKESFKLLTLEIRDFLQESRNHLNQIEERIYHHSQANKEAYLDALNTTFAPHFVDTLKAFSRRLDVEFSAVVGKDLRKAYVQFFRREVGEFYSKSVFIGRALHKPRGYAGDFEMMNQIYRDELDGKSFFERLIHKYGINEFSSLSVRYRKNYLMTKIKDVASRGGRITIGSLACGPAREVVEYLDTLDPEESARYTFVLMDQDTEALLDARRNIGSRINSRGLKCEVYFVPISVKNILEQSEAASGLQELQFDFVYTAGLYDYLTQPVAQALTSEVLKCVKNNGLMIVGNFHPSNPTKTISELVADWRLIHRTGDDMMGLVPDNAVQSKKLHFDSQEIDVFLEIIK